MSGIDPFSSPLLKESIQLYQYLGTINGVEGSLVATLGVTPTPIIQWIYSSTNDSVGNQRNPTDVKGVNFRIPNQHIYANGFVQRSGTAIWHYEGITNFAEQGIPPGAITDMTVFVPVAKFHEVHHLDETYISSRDFARKAGGSERELLSNRGSGKQFEVQLDSKWFVIFDTTQEALEWLMDKSHTNTGCLLTTKMFISYKDDTSPNGLSIDEFEKKLGYIFMLLSVANGGFTQHLITSCYHITDKGAVEYNRYYAPKVTPIEQVGRSWFTDESDLGAYLRCCHTLEKMMQANLWLDTLPAIIIWYFQCIQPEQGYLKPWPVAANALGAALERICDTLIEEVPIIKSNYIAKTKITSDDFTTKERIKAVLLHIGLLNIDGYHFEKYVIEFVRIRNDATHVKQKSKLTGKDRYDRIFMAVQWLEEILLWRLGYSGEHRIQTAPGRQSMPVKYNLSVRDSSW